MGQLAIISMIQNDKEVEKVIKKYGHDFDFSFGLKKTFEKKPSPYLLLTDISSLEKFSELFKKNIPLKNLLKGLLIKETKDEKGSLYPFLDSLKFSTKHVIDFCRAEELERIIYAWKIGAQNDLIASVEIIGNKVFIKGCNFENYFIPISSINAFNGADEKSLKVFELALRGNYVHWPEIDVHLDFESFKVANDPKYRLKIQQQLSEDNVLYGEAIKKLRKEFSLNQSEMALSDKQIRRYENGDQRPTLKAYESLAKSHGMTVNTYLERLAEVYQQIKTNS